MGGMLCRVHLLDSQPLSAHSLRDAARHGIDPEHRTWVRALADYFFKKKYPRLPLQRFRLEALTPFTRSVILATRRVPMGRSWTYTDLAREMGYSPDFRRAVAGALGRNPMPLFFPCHRIVGQEDLGGFSSGLRWKSRLLAHEGVRV